MRPVGISWQAWKPREGAKRKLEEVIPALGQNFKDRVYVTDEIWCNYGKAMWPWYYSVPYFPADITWRDRNSKVAVIQLDGKTSSGNKNLPKDQVEALTDYLTNAGLKVVALCYEDHDGKYIPLREWVETLVSAEVFFGVCSGGLHMAHCTLTPKIAFVNDYAYSLLDPEKSSHRNESFVHFKDFYELKARLEN